MNNPVLVNRSMLMPPPKLVLTANGLELHEWNVTWQTYYQRDSWTWTRFDEARAALGEEE